MVYGLREKEESFQFSFVIYTFPAYQPTVIRDKAKEFKAFYDDLINLLILNLTTVRGVCV